MGDGGEGEAGVVFPDKRAAFPEEKAVTYMLPEGDDARGVCAAFAIAPVAAACDRLDLGASHWARTLLQCDTSSVI